MIHFKTYALLLILTVLLTGFSQANCTLHEAAYNGDAELVDQFIAAGIDPDARDSFGGTALHAAMFQKNMHIVEKLIKAGLDINAQGTSNGYTPLHDAVWDNNAPAANVLIRHGARLDIKGKDGLTPLEKAKAEGKNELIRILTAAQLRGTRYDGFINQS